MRYLVAYILVLSILTFQFTELLIYMSFKLNQDYIAKNLCVEKDVEGSTCNGCCQLKKKLEEQEQQKETAPPAQSEKLDITFCMLQQSKSDLYCSGRTQFRMFYRGIYSFLIYNQIFHPPRL